MQDKFILVTKRVKLQQNRLCNKILEAAIYEVRSWSSMTI